MSITYRLGQLSDVEKIVDFQLTMAMETENLELDRPTVVKGVRHVMENDIIGRYLVAEHAEELVACMLNIYEWSEWRNGNVIWIHSLYVRPDMRAKGIFKTMYEQLKEEVENSEGYRGIRLYVDRTNLPAQQVYQAIGMSKEHYEMYEWLCE